MPCAKRLAEIYSDRADREALFLLMEEGEDFFAPAGNVHAAGDFFNTISRLSEREAWREQRDELRDRYSRRTRN